MQKVNIFDQGHSRSTTLPDDRSHPVKVIKRVPRGYDLLLDVTAIEAQGRGGFCVHIFERMQLKMKSGNGDRVTGPSNSERIRGRQIKVLNFYRDGKESLTRISIRLGLFDGRALCLWPTS
jgi:hypothetical protein